MKNTFVALSAIAAVSALSGCMTQPVDQPGSVNPTATWNSITGTLSNVRYYKSDVDATYQAGEKALRDLNIFVTGYTKTKNGYTLYGRAVGDVKVTVDITRRATTDKKSGTQTPYTEVAVSYGTIGDLAPALQIISKMSARLPREG